MMNEVAIYNRKKVGIIRPNQCITTLLFLRMLMLNRFRSPPIYSNVPCNIYTLSPLSLSLSTMATASSSPNNSCNPPTVNEVDPDTTFVVVANPDTFRAVVQRLTGAAAGERERMPAARKLEIKLHRDNGGAALHALSSSARKHVKEYAAARGRAREEEEEMAIAAKGFYLHRSPLSTPAGSDPPELLPLFPLHSPTRSYESSSF